MWISNFSRVEKDRVSYSIFYLIQTWSIRNFQTGEHVFNSSMPLQSFLNFSTLKMKGTDSGIQFSNFSNEADSKFSNRNLFSNTHSTLFPNSHDAERGVDSGWNFQKMNINSKEYKLQTSQSISFSRVSQRMFLKAWSFGIIIGYISLHVSLTCWNVCELKNKNIYYVSIRS